MTTIAKVFGTMGMLLAVLHCSAQAHPMDDRGYIVRVGDQIPSFELTDIEGTTFSSKSLLGTTYVLQFTASWCGVCRAEMPHLESEVWQRFSGKPFLLIGVDLDEPQEKVTQFAASTGVTYPMAPDPGGELFYQIAGPKSGVTRNVVVDAKGEIVFLTRLFDESEFNAMIEVIDSILSR